MTKSLTILGFLILGFDAADLTITGVAVLAVVILMIAFWLAGGFTRAFWVADDPTEPQRTYPPVTTCRVNQDYVDPFAEDAR